MQLAGAGTAVYRGQSHNTVNFNLNLIPSTKANSKWIIDLNVVKHKSIQLLEGNIWRTLS